MKQLFSAFYRKLEETDMRFERYLKGRIGLNYRLIAITGVRGTGKTTLLLQQIKDLQNAYLALDGIETGYKNEIPLWLFGFLY